MSRAVQPHGRRTSLVDLTESNPTQRRAALSGGSAHALAAPTARSVYDPQPFGLAPRGRPWPATSRGAASPSIPSRIVLSASTSEAYSWLFKLLCDPGDRCSSRSRAIRYSST